jgi:5'-methylthioadenosine phosphorylase
MTGHTRCAIIAGSQGYRWLEALGGESARVEPVQTPFGPSPPMHIVRAGEAEVAVLSRHGEKGYQVSAPFVNYRANIWALKELGVERIVAWSGPGAIDTGIPIGDILVPGDIIDETRDRSSTFFEGLGVGFIRQNPVFCPELAEGLRSAIEARQGHCRTGDVYVCTQGPRLETAAEIRKFASYGGTLVGMTLAPEAFLAKELEMCYCPVCYVTNYAEGVVERPYRPGELFEGMLSKEEKAKVDAAVEMLPRILIEALLSLSEHRACQCSRSMERYRLRGDIGDDWHTWVGKLEG